MFIFFGVRETEVKTAPLLGGASQSAKLHVTIFARYAHVFWIPVLPAGKRVVVHSADRQGVMFVKDLPDALKLQVKQLKSETKRPWWHYIVPLLIVLFFGSAIVSAIFTIVASA